MLRNSHLTANPLMDSLTYFYTGGTNRLDHIRDRNAGSTAHSNNYAPAVDIKDQAAGNYQYDAIGNLKSSEWMGDDDISWNIYGKVVEVEKRALAGVTSRFLHYYYDPSGNKVGETVRQGSGGSAYYNHRWYVRDAQGNVLATYEVNNAAGASAGTLKLKEHYLYGSSRLGIINRDQDADADKLTAVDEDNLGDTYLLNFTRGNKFFELTNHLGNVLTVLSDKKIGRKASDPSMISIYDFDMVTAADYTPFGMVMLGRNFSFLSRYRYGFNGKEMDNEVKGAGNLLDYGNRLYDPLAGRFLSVDPLTRDYAFYSPYQYAGNKPIKFTDLDGLEENGNSTDVKIPIPILPVINKDRILSAPKGYFFQADTRTQEQRRAAIQRAEHAKTMNRMYNTDDDFSFRIFSGIGASALSYGEGDVAEYAIGKGLQGVRFLKNVITNAGKIPGAGIRGVNLVSAEVLSDAQKVALGGSQALRTVNTPYGIAEQAISKEAYAAIDEVNKGATLYRIGTLGKSQAGEAQFWSLENPANFLNNPEAFASRFGMPCNFHEPSIISCPELRT